MIWTKLSWRYNIIIPSTRWNLCGDGLSLTHWSNRVETWRQPPTSCSLSIKSWIRWRRGLQHLLSKCYNNNFTLFCSCFLLLSSSHHHRYFLGSTLYWFIELHFIYNDLREINFGFSCWKYFYLGSLGFSFIYYFLGFSHSFKFSCLASIINFWFYLPPLNVSDHLPLCCSKIIKKESHACTWLRSWVIAENEQERREKKREEEKKNRGERRESGERYSHYTGLCNLQRSAFVCVGFASMQCHGSNRQTEPNWVRKGNCACVCVAICSPSPTSLRFFKLLLCCIIHACTFHSTTQGLIFSMPLL